MNLIKGIRNLFMISTPNILVVLCILLIVSLIYLNSNSIELFNNNDYLSLFIDKYITKIQNNNEYKLTLATQEQRIKDLSDSVIKLINP